MHSHSPPAGIEVVGVYPVLEASEPCHLVEILIRNAAGFDPSQFQQEQPGRSREDWQTAWDERVLSEAGDSVAANSWEIEPDDLRGTVRLAFFLHYLDPARPLQTPFGPIPLPQPTERPARLATIEYEEP